MKIDIQFETLKNNSSILCKLGKCKKYQRDILHEKIKNLMQNDPSHSILAIYTMGNFEDSPENIIIYRNNLIIIVREKSNQMNIIGDVSMDDTEFLEHLLSSLHHYFAFVSGNSLINTLLQFSFFDNSIRNKVFILDEFKPVNITKKLIIFHKEKGMEYINIFTNYYNYDMDDLDRILVRPHVMLIENNEVLAVARVNGLIYDMAVIGGVYTPIQHRGKGFSKQVNSGLVSYLKTLVKTIFLETDTQNHAALSVYQSLGYKEIGISAFFERDIKFIEDIIIGDRNY